MEISKQAGGGDFASLKINGNTVCEIAEENVSGTNWTGKLITNYTQKTRLIIGKITAGTDGTIAFPGFAYASTPIVICGINGSSSTNGVSYRTMSACDISTTSFTYQTTGSTEKTFIVYGSY